MAHHKSAKKAARQTIKRTARNKSVISRVRTFIRKFEEMVAQDKAKAAEFLKTVQSVVMRGVTKGVLAKNTAARTISRLSAKLKKAA